MGDNDEPRRAFTEVISRANNWFLAGLCALMTTLVSFLTLESDLVAGSLAGACAAGALIWVVRVARVESWWIDRRSLYRQTRRGSTSYDLAELVDIRYVWGPYSDGYVDLRFGRGTVSLPLTEVTLELRTAIGDVVRECLPGRVFGDVRAMRALGMRRH